MFYQFYTRFRSSNAFLICLCLFITYWLIWNSFLSWQHFDNSGFERLNLILSIEGSVSIAFLLRDSKQQEQLIKKQLTYMLHLMEAMLARREAEDLSKKGDS